MITKRYHLACFVSMIVLMLVCISQIAYASCGGATYHNWLFWSAIVDGLTLDVMSVLTLISAIYLKMMIPKEKHSDTASGVRIFIAYIMGAVNLLLGFFGVMGSSGYMASAALGLIVTISVIISVLICAAINVWGARQAVAHLREVSPDHFDGDCKKRAKNLIDVHYAYRYSVQLLGVIAVIYLLVAVKCFQCMSNLKYFGFFLLFSIPAIIIFVVTRLFIPKHIEQKLSEELKALGERESQEEAQ